MDTHYAYDHTDRFASHADMDTAETGHRKSPTAAARKAVTRPVVATVEFGSGWYHDAAIQDASEAHANPYR